MSVSISKVLWEFSHAYLFTYCPWLLSCREEYLSQNRWATKHKIYSWAFYRKNLQIPPHEARFKSVWFDCILVMSCSLPSMPLTMGFSLLEMSFSSLSEYITTLSLQTLSQISFYLNKKFFEKIKQRLLLWRGNGCQGACSPVARILELDWSQSNVQNSTQ